MATLLDVVSPKLTMDADQLANKRTIATGQIVDGLRRLREGLQNDTQGCNYNCRCRILGALIKGMDRFHVFDPTHQPLLGHSLADTIQHIRNITVPYDYYDYRGCRCTVSSLTESFLRQVESDIMELK